MWRNIHFIVLNSGQLWWQTSKEDGLIDSIRYAFWSWLRLRSYLVVRPHANKCYVAWINLYFVFLLDNDLRNCFFRCIMESIPLRGSKIRIHKCYGWRTSVNLDPFFRDRSVRPKDMAVRNFIHATNCGRNIHDSRICDIPVADLPICARGEEREADILQHIKNASVLFGLDHSLCYDRRHLAPNNS
jgi:hypothetical protein